MALADLVHLNGLAECLLCVSMKRRISSRSSLTLVKASRLSERRSKCPNQVSAALSHDALVGVKCRKAGMGSQEVAYRFGRVRAAVVHDQVQRQFGRRRTVDLRKELPGLRCAMAPGDTAEHLAGGDVEGSIQTFVP